MALRKITIQIEDEQYQKLRKEAFDRNISMGEQLRFYLDRSLGTSEDKPTTITYKKDVPGTNEPLSVINVDLDKINFPDASQLQDPSFGLVRKRPTDLTRVEGPEYTEYGGPLCQDTKLAEIRATILLFCFSVFLKDVRSSFVKIHFGWCLIIKCLMRTLVIIKCEVAS
jgi:hypothetical protein